MYMGIDIGTSAVKAAVIDEAGVVVDQASAPLNISRPRPLWSEQDPADWWSATNIAVSDLQLPLRKAVRAIGLSGQMHGATLLDKRHRALRPAILWNDGRSSAQCAELETALPAMTQITGNRAMPGFTAPKLMWVRSHEPDIFAGTAMVLLPKDYVRLRMTGDTASDMSDSAGTLWLTSRSAVGRKSCWQAPGSMPGKCRGCTRATILRANCAPNWPKPGACRGCPWLREAATMRPEPSASAWFAPAMPFYRWAPRAYYFWRMTAIGPTRPAAFIPSAMRCPGIGIRCR